MRRSFRWIASGVVVMAALMVGASRAHAITLSEIMQLTKAGVGDEVLLALIEVDQRVFPIDPETIQALKAAGVSQPVIVAIVKSGRMPQAEAPAAMIENTPPPDPPQPQVVVVDRPVIHEVPVPVPVYVAVGTYAHGRFRDRANTAYRPSIGLPPYPQASTVSPLVDRPEPRKRAEPVYWGWGGKLRPDAWQPAPKK